MSSLKIVNVVATADLREPVDIEAAGLQKNFLHDSEIYMVEESPTINLKQ